jgi:hypothetical protein
MTVPSSLSSTVIIDPSGIGLVFTFHVIGALYDVSDESTIGLVCQLGAYAA